MDLSAARRRPISSSPSTWIVGQVACGNRLSKSDGASNRAGYVSGYKNTDNHREESHVGR
ncbi:hypothetical protein J2776_002910 [Paraburkholderia caledonica]|uniref:Uncharacterized protein n=1 Tax=Paraburkholderia caledonica TaxID=134536 RepID=A0ABU1KZ12_9BURK|nr:hypothetical protein [Paraburkholderia caledonica]